MALRSSAPLVALIAASASIGRVAARGVDPIPPPYLPEAIVDAGRPSTPMTGLGAHRTGCDCRECDFFECLWSPFATGEDEDGPINTDRPTFTPSNATVPRGRFQIETGYTFTHDLTARTRTSGHVFPEVSGRYGLTDRLELRTFWAGQTYSAERDRLTGALRRFDGQNDLLAGFRIGLLDGDGWIPKTAITTDVSIPVGTTPSSLGSVEPVLFLIYGWSLTDRLSIVGSSGFAAQVDRDLGGGPDDSFERFSQSLVASYSIGDKTTLFYEWFVLASTNALDNRPLHSMDGGLLYLITPNLQFDLRAGFGLGDRPDDFFTGAGLSWRY